MRTKSEARRQAILETAARVFNEVGFEQASMSEIAARVGGSKATLYNYFPSKDALFTAVVQTIAGPKIQKSFTALQMSDNLEEALNAFGVSYLESILSPDLIAMRRMVLHDADRTEVGRLTYEHGPKAGCMIISTFLQSAMDAKKLRMADSWIAAMHLRALYESEVLELRLLGVLKEVDHKKITEVVARAVQVFMDSYGYKASGAKSPSAKTR